MKQKRIHLFAVSVALVTLVLMSQSGINQATLLVPNRILVDTLVGTDGTLVEGLELIAAEGPALIAQYYHWGGQKTFSLNPDHSAFDNLDVLYIISSNQANWHDYWPRSIWEFRDGATVVFQFSQNLEDSLDDAEEIIPELNTWMGTTLDILYGAYDSITETTYLFYWGYMSPQDHSDFIYDEFYDMLETTGSNGYTNFIKDEVIASSPVSVVATGLVRQETEWVPLAVAAFILENGISINENNIHNMSIGSAFDYSGSIMPISSSLYSKIVFKLPYVANIYDSYPNTDNLYPELTGEFDWTLKAGEYIDESYEDIYVTYDMAVEELETFPQITSEVDVNITYLHSTTDPVLNYTIEMTNSGDEKAYNVTFAWDLGKGRPEPVEIPLFDSDTYMYNSTIWKYYDIRDGLLYDTYQGFGAEILIKGWFTYLNGTLIPTENMPIGETGYVMLNISAVFHKIMPPRTFFSFNHSNNLAEITLENGNFALYGNIEDLEEGASESFWWSIGDLPAKDDIFFAPGYTVENITEQYYNITIFENTSVYDLVGNNLADYIVQEQLANGSDLRWPPLNPEFIPGVMFRYEDNATREYFGWSNGVVIQLYDDDAILKTILSLNSTIYEIDDVAQIDVSIENIGDAPATNVQVMGFHAQLGPDWQLRDIQEFSGEETVENGTINPGETKTHTFLRNVSTFLGIHPVGVVVDYTTEESEGYDGAFNRTDISNVASNLIVALVLPKPDKAGEDEPSYPSPEVNVSVTWTDENGGNLTEDDVIEIRTEVTNIGDEATTIKLFSYFPSRIAHIDMSKSYSGKNFKVTDISGNTLTDYDEGFAIDHPDWPISVAAVGGLHLAPNAGIVFYYKLIVDETGDLFVPPVSVEYDSRYPMAGASGMEGVSGETGETNPLAIKISTSIAKGVSSSIKFSIQDEATSSSKWTSFSGASLMSAYAAVSPPEESSTASTGPPTTSGGASGFTTLTSFIFENMRLMIVVLAIPILVLSVRELRRKRK